MHIHYRFKHVYETLKLKCLEFLAIFRLFLVRQLSNKQIAKDFMRLLKKYKHLISTDLKIYILEVLKKKAPFISYINTTNYEML